MKVILLMALSLGLSLTTQASEKIQVTLLPPNSESALAPLARSSYDFGFVWVNTINRVTFRITNTSQTSLNYRSAQIFGSQYNAWHNCAKGILPQGSCKVTIELWPFSEGSQNGQFRLNFVEDSSIIDLWGYARR